MDHQQLPESAIDLIPARVDPADIIAIIQRHCPAWSVEEITRHVMDMLGNTVATVVSPQDRDWAP